MADFQANSAGSGSTRAQRFPLNMLLHYRVSGERNWREGRTENISRSGVLFRGEHVVEPNTPVEMSFVLPMEISGQGAAEVVCQGNIVRTVLATGTDTLPALAAAILDYQFLRRQDIADARGA